MGIAREHELHRRRFGRNLGVGVTLVAFAALIFGLTLAKVSQNGAVQGFDHTFRPEMTAPAATEEVRQ